MFWVKRIENVSLFSSNCLHSQWLLIAPQMDAREEKSILEKASSDYFYTQFVYWKMAKLRNKEFEYN